MKTRRPGSQGVIFWTQRGKCENAWQAKCCGQSGKWGHLMFAIVCVLTHISIQVCVYAYLHICVFVYICVCLTWGHFTPVSVCPPSHLNPGLSEYFGKSHNWRNFSTKLCPQEKDFTLWKMFYNTWTFISNKWQQNIFFCINIFYGTEIALIKVVVKVPVQCYILSIPM